MASAEPSPEHLLCDTSFVGHQGRRTSLPAAYDHWEAELLHRIEVGVKAISVITIAEHRRGYLNAKWGERKIQEAEARLLSYLPIPLDDEILNEWARLKQLCGQAGLSVGDNDLWIAATASSRGMPLVTCDRDHARITDDRLEVIYLPAPA